MLLAALFLALAGQQAHPGIAVDLYPTQMTREGTLTLRFAFTPAEKLARGLKLRLGLDLPSAELAVSEHELEPDPARWKPGQRVDWQLPLALDPDAGLESGDWIGVLVGFADADGLHFAPAGTEPLEDGLTELTTLTAPSFLGAKGAAYLTALEEAARAMQKAGDPAGAWLTLVDALREANDDATKERLRDALLEIGRFDPAPLTPTEEGIVAWRIDQEKLRYYRLIAGRMYDRGELHGALRLLEDAGGSLAEESGVPVAEALDEAERVSHDIEDLRNEIVTRRTPEEEARVQALIAEHGLTAKLRKETEKLVAAGEHAVALELLRQLRKSRDDEVEAGAWARIPEVEALHLAATPPAQLAQVRAAIEHPAWARTTVVPSHAFLFIGPKKLVEEIPAPSKLAFDLAYVFVTDLFGRVPNPEGDRVTVYFKELWDFGGGVGGGKIIDIGSADPAPKKAVRVDTGLLYHELTHCVDDTAPIFAGFREGLANLGAAYAFEALDQDADALHSFDANLEQFRRYFLERDLEYWRIQNYGPSAGFFLYFVATYATLGPGQHDWSTLRQFFREYREAAVRDGREPYVVRALAHFLRRAFGPRVYDDLVGFGFPLDEPDRRAVSLEMSAFEEDELERFYETFAAWPGSPLPRDLLQRELVQALRRDRARAAELKQLLGVVEAWKTIGPFFVKQGDAGAHVHPPEYQVDFDESVTALRATRDDTTSLEWRDPIPGETPKERPDVLLLPTGYVRFDYQPYGQQNSAIYALTHVTVPEATDALAHVRADDDLALFVNGVRMTQYEGRGRNGSTRLDWRGPDSPLPDGMRVPIRLRAGRNRILVKIANQAGPAGVALALSKPDGSHLAFTADALEPDPPADAKEPGWKRVASIDARSFKRKSKATVGGFKNQGKAVFGTDTGGGVGWRLFTVRPGFPKDSPSNLAWLSDSVTEDLSDARVELTLEAEPIAPKLVLTLQGEGDTDGLSGWNLILLPRGGDTFGARLERYDRLVIETPTLSMPAAEEQRVLAFELRDGVASASLDELALFERVSVEPIAGRTRIGIATWGPSPRIRALELYAPRR